MDVLIKIHKNEGINMTSIQKSLGGHHSTIKKAVNFWEYIGAVERRGKKKECLHITKFGLRLLANTGKINDW